MIGEKAMIRVRLSSKDAYYAGGLVNGAKMFDFFGDVITELTIRLDGDESLLRGYEDVELFAPVHAGDYMEYHGWIEKIGNTSRIIKLEAYKCIELANDPSLPVSAANVLPAKLLTGRATAIAVVPKQCQRGFQDKAFNTKE